MGGPSGGGFIGNLVKSLNSQKPTSDSSVTATPSTPVSGSSLGSGIGMGGSSGDTSIGAMLGYGASNPSMGSISSVSTSNVKLGAQSNSTPNTQQDALIKGRSSTMLTGGTGLSGGLGSTSKKLLGN